MKSKWFIAAHAGGSSIGHAAQGFRNAHGHVGGNSAAFGKNAAQSALSGSSALSGQSSGFNNVAGSSMGAQGLFY